MTIVNMSQKVVSRACGLTPAKLYQLHKNDKLFYDRERLQRLLQSWHSSKANSYLFTLFNGASVKDCFQLAEIAPIVKQLEQQLVPNAKQYRFIEENLNYFKNLLDKKFEYLVLDGQHRIDTMVRYFDDEIFFEPEEVIELRIGDEKGTTDVAGKFSSLPEEIQDYLMNEIPLVVIVYETGDLRELARIFITSNSMMAMTKHEKRILNYNENNRWLNTVCLHDTNIKSMFKCIGSGMTQEYDLKHKGDTLFVAEMLTYINNNMYEGYDSDVLDNILGAYPTGNPKISQNDRETTLSILSTMADGCAQYDKELLSKFSKSSYYNLFYTLSFIMQKNNVWGKKKNIDGVYKVKDKLDFVKWFFDCEHERLNAAGTYTEYLNPITNKTKKQMDDYSFRKHNEDQKHARKESFKDKGGSKYDFDSWARVRYLLEDLNSDLTKLEKFGTISKVGTRSNSKQRDELMVKHNVKLSKSKGLHLDEIVPVSKGGESTFENTRFVDAKTNIRDSNRIKRII